MADSNERIENIDDIQNIQVEPAENTESIAVEDYFEPADNLTVEPEESVTIDNGEEDYVYDNLEINVDSAGFDNGDGYVYDDEYIVDSEIEYEESQSEDVDLPKKKFSRPKDQRAIARQRRNKVIGRVFATIFVLIFVGILVATTTITYKTADDIWWDNVGKEADVKFSELFGLFNGVIDSNEDKIVTKGFNEGDLNDFYANLKRKLFLAQDYDLSISKIITTLMSSTDSDNSQDAQSQGYATIGVDGCDLQYVYYNTDGVVTVSDVKPTSEEIGEPSGDNDGNSSLTGNEELDKLLQEIKFDFSYLADYDGEQNILEITDKQLGAAVNDAFHALSGSFSQLKELETTIGKPLNEVLAVKQIVISGKELDNTQTKLKITLEVKVKDLLAEIIKKQGVPEIVNSILPEKLYASVTAYPFDATKPIEASINRLKEEKVNKIVRIVDVILNKTGKTTSISDLLVQVNGKVVEVLNQAQEKMPITFVPTQGSVDLYPIETLMSMLGVEVSEQAFLYMLKDIKLPTGESLGLIMPTQEEKLQYNNEFVSELTSKYFLDNNIANISADNTIKDVMNFASSENALDAVLLNDRNNLSIYNSGYGQHLKVRTYYSALASMLSDYVNNEGMLGDIKADIVGMSYASRQEILTVDIRISLAEMLGFDDDSVMSSLINQLVPEYIYVSANICINADKNTPTTIEINKVGEENSKKHLQTLTALAEKFGMDTSSLTYDGVCAQIDEGLQTGLNQMQEQIGCEIIFTEECAYLPNLFEVVCGTGLLDESEERKIAPENLFNIMKQVYTYDLDSSDRNRTSDLSGFIGELESKYYLKQGKIDELIEENGDGNLLKSVMGLAKTYGAAIDKDALAKDKRGLNEIYPQMTAGEFAYVMRFNLDMENMSDVLKSSDILGAKITDKEMIVYLQANLYDNKNRAQSGSEIGEEDIDLSKYSNLLPQSVFISLTIDIDKIGEAEGNCVKVTLDGMQDEYMSDFFSMVRKLTGSEFTESEIELEISAQLKDYMKDIKGIEYRFENGALRIDNLFNVIAKSELVQSDEAGAHVFTPSEIRRLLQELYGYDYKATSGEFTAAKNLDHFIDEELYNKYFISKEFETTLKGYVGEDVLLDGFTKDLKGNNFIGKIRMDALTSLDNVTDVEGMSQTQIDRELAEKFKPIFTKEEIAYLLRSNISAAGDMPFIKDQKVIYANNDENIMTLTLQGKGNLDDENAIGLMPEYFYISVTIELGSIVNGARTDMNVCAIDINSISYVEGKGKEQDLQLLLTLIERIQSKTQGEPVKENSIADKLDEIEEQLNSKGGFRDSIHNEVFTVSFLAEGGFMLNETLYQIALNSVYGAKANDMSTWANMPSEIDFRNGLCKVNNMPSTYEYSQGVFINFEEGNKANSYQGALNEINVKYALAEELQEGKIGLFSALGNYAKDYATSIDGYKLTDEFHRIRTYEELRPSIDGSELIWMLESSVTFEADGYQDAEMSALYIRNDKMILVYKSPINIDNEDEEYAKLLPSVMAIVVCIDLNAIDNIKILCTKVSINNLLDKEVDAVQSMLTKLNEKANDGSESKSMAEANKECSDSVRSTIKSLTDNVNVRYESGATAGNKTESGTMILDSIYEIAAQKINDNSEPKEDDVEADEVKKTLEALFMGLNIKAYTPPAGLSAEDMSVSYTTVSSEERGSNLLLTLPSSFTDRNFTIRGAIGGWNIASMIDTRELLEPLGLDKNAQGSDDILKLKHTALIPNKGNGNATFDAIREELGSLGDGEYFLITLDMDMQAAVGKKMSILPQRMDLSLCMDLANDGISIKYNAMTDDERQLLSRLVKTSRSDGESGLDLSGTDAVKTEIMNMVIIEEQFMGYTFTLTLGDLLSSGGTVLPIDVARSQVIRDDNVILGMGAMIINYTDEIII